MTLRSGSRGKRAGAHRAPRPLSRRQGSEVGTPSAGRPLGKLRGGSARAGKAANGNGSTGAAMGGLRSRAVIARTGVVAVVAALVGVGVAYGGSSSAEGTVYQFLLAWQSKQYLQAARLTTGQPSLVAGELAGAYRQLDASDLSLTMTSVTEHGSTAEAQFAASIGLGSRGLVWSYDGSFRLRADGSGWQVVWRPSVIMPKLGYNERLAVVTTERPRQYLEDSSGKPLTIPSPAYEIGVIPGHLRHPALTAREISKITLLPANQLLGVIEAAPSRQFLELITLPPTSTKRRELAAVPGVLVKRVDERLFDSIAPDVVGTVDTELDPGLRKSGVPYLPGTTVGETGLEQTYQQKLTGTPRTQVVIQRDGVPVEVLKSFPGSLAKPVRTTLQSSIQIAANNALASVPASAAIVAVRPGTGQILAVASREADRMPALQPLYGRYLPGQAFTIVSSAAIMEASSSVTPDKTVSCFQTNSINGHAFSNDPPEPRLGTSATFQKDFAYACSTAFAGLSLYMSSEDLSKIAAKFGVGGWQLPPLSQYFAGTIGQPSGEAQLAADTIGEGQVEMSPLGMALAAAVVDESGRWHPPSLIPGVADPSNASENAMSAQVVSDLQDLMHNAVTAGAGRAANVGGDVFGQVGNAAYGTHGLRISWFVGYQGKGIAFAVVELGRSATNSAASLAGTFLKNVRAGT
jgi:cell division protein FtsI/penicillin-binding protein 2